MTIAQNLAKLNIILPAAPAPAANYVPWVISGNQLIVSGQISKEGDTLLKGRLGESLTTEQGQAAARVCAINIIAQANAALDGNLDRITRVLRLGGFVYSTPDFTDQPAVINGASDLMVAVFGEKGRHARAAVGCVSLPLGVCVEVDGIFEIE